MSDPVVLLERRDDGVAVVTLNNGKVNALSGAVVDALHEIAKDLTAKTGVSYLDPYHQVTTNDGLGVDVQIKQQTRNRSREIDEVFSLQ